MVDARNLWSRHRITLGRLYRQGIDLRLFVKGITINPINRASEISLKTGQYIVRQIEIV